MPVCVAFSPPVAMYCVSQDTSKHHASILYNTHTCTVTGVHDRKLGTPALLPALIFKQISYRDTVVTLPRDKTVYRYLKCHVNT